MKCLECGEKWTTELPKEDLDSTYCPFCVRQQAVEIDATLYQLPDHRHRWDQDFRDWACITVFFIMACLFLACMIGSFNNPGGR